MTPSDVINAVLDVEGGACNNPCDPGGATCWGVTQNTARAHGYAGDMAKLPRATAYTILMNTYFIEPHFDQVFKLSPRIAAELTDMGINEGVGIASMYFQKSLNIFNKQGSLYPDVHIDATVGATTIAAFTTFIKRPGAESVMLKALTCLRGARYIDIGEKNPKLEEFEFGWFVNRITVQP